MLKKIGNYELGQVLDTASLREVSKEQLAAMFQNDPNWMKSKQERVYSTEDYTNNFRFQKVYEGENIPFLEASWSVWIFLVADKIKSINAYRYASSKEEGDFLFTKALKYITDSMGKYTKHPFLSNQYAWEWAEGTVGLVKQAIWGKQMIALSISEK